MGGKKSVTLWSVIMLVSLFLTAITAAAQEKIAFVRFLSGGGGYEIFIMDPDGSGQTQLTDSAGAPARPAFSPDGSKIVFDYRVGFDNPDIYVMNADGTGQTNLTGNDDAQNIEASFSPDGSKIVFMSSRDGKLEVYVMNADGTDQTRVTTNDCQEVEPSFSPDGSKILFQGRCNFVLDIYVVNTDGTGLTNLTPNAQTDCCSSDFRPAFRPDGGKIVFASDRDGPYELYTMNADGTNQARLTLTGKDDEPSYSPDGSKIVFSSTRHGNPQEIYVMDADGTGVARLTFGGGSSPSWYGPSLVPTDTTAPTISITTPANGATYTKGESSAAGYSCQDEPGGSGLVSCVGTVANGAAIDTSTVGSHTFAVTATDNAGNSFTLTNTYNVAYDFTGFFQPVENLPTLNVASAGGAVALKFSLAGDQGLAIFALVNPTSSPIACDASDPSTEIEETVSVGGSGLSYDAVTDQYTYIWRTNRAWRGTCRMLIVSLHDGTQHLAKFKFR